MSVSSFFPWLSLSVNLDSLDRKLRMSTQEDITIKRVFITHSGLVHIVLVAPATIADRMCNDHGCSRIKG